MYVVALALWSLFLIAAVPYTMRARDPAARALAAYLIFVMLFTVGSFAIFAALVAILQALGQASVLSSPLGAAVFLVVVFAPAFFIARWQLRKPPRAPRMP